MEIIEMNIKDFLETARQHLFGMIAAQQPTALQSKAC